MRLKTSKSKNAIFAGLASDKIKDFNIKEVRGFVITQFINNLKDKDKEIVFDNNDWRIIDDLKNTYIINDISNDEVLREKYYNTLFYKIIQTETAHVK